MTGEQPDLAALRRVVPELAHVLCRIEHDLDPGYVVGCDGCEAAIAALLDAAEEAERLLGSLVASEGAAEQVREHRDELREERDAARAEVAALRENQDAWAEAAIRHAKLRDGVAGLAEWVETERDHTRRAIKSCQDQCGYSPDFDYHRWLGLAKARDEVAVKLRALLDEGGE